MGNQELKPLVSLPDYPPNKVNPFERPCFEVTLVVSHKRDYCMEIIEQEVLLISFLAKRKALHRHIVNVCHIVNQS